MEWTDSAKEELANYVSALTKQKNGEEYEEVYSDIEQHVQEELKGKELTVITLESVQKILASMGGAEEAGEQDHVPEDVEQKTFIYPEKVQDKLVKYHSSKPSVWKTFCRWMAAVILPSLTIGVEMITHACASVYFDPIPTWIHICLLIFTVFASWIFLVKTISEESLSNKWMSFIMGFSIVVVGYYALLFLPISPFGLLGILYLGLGFLVLAPILMFISQLRMILQLKNKRLLKWGILLGVFALLVPEVPAVLYRWQLDKYAVGNEKQKEEAVYWLRRTAAENDLLALCYNHLNRGPGVGAVGLICNTLHLERPNVEESKILFYKVTGKPYNSVKPEIDKMGKRGVAISDWHWDNAHGGDDVAGRIKGLYMTQSRLDVHVDKASQIGYAEWIIEFENQSSRDREARMKFVLPDEGLVSRVTLWVDGEEREAAYNSVSKVKKAYKEIAVVQRRDPVLVNMCAANTVRLQCFPVLSSGGKMKMKVGYNFKATEHIKAPFILERNYSIKESFQHSIFVQGEVRFAGKDDIQTFDQYQGFSKQMNYQQFQEQSVAIKTLQKNSVIWTKDSQGERYVVRTAKNVPRENRKVVLVVDGSERMKQWQDSLQKLAEKYNFEKIYFAGDKVQQVSSLKGLRFEGGRDNVPAIQEALNTGCDVLWVHAGQPVDFGTHEGIVQQLERGFSQSHLYSIGTAHGGNALLESLWKFQRVKKSVIATHQDELVRQFESILGDQLVYQYQWVDTQPSDGVKVWDHLVHEAVFEEVNKAWLDGNISKEQRENASKYQLVTPVSGAVVLETEEQYKQTGLKPVDGSHSPVIPTVIPEPSSLILLALSSVGLFHRRRRKS